MKKIFLALVMAVVMSFGLVGCCDDSQPKMLDFRDESSPFIIVYSGDYYEIVYHKDTRVMYLMSDFDYNYGTFTVMLNADGSPMLYEENVRENS